MSGTNVSVGAMATTGGRLSREPVAAGDVTIAPANQASWADLKAIFGTTDQGHCSCQRFKTTGWFWAQATDEGRRQQFRDQVNCDDPDAASTTGLVAYLREPGGTSVPIGWVAVEGYPMINQPGKEVTWGELHVGARQVFEEAGFTEVGHPTPRRAAGLSQGRAPKPRPAPPRHGPGPR
jgi:hypothetical protein